MKVYCKDCEHYVGAKYWAPDTSACHNGTEDHPVYGMMDKYADCTKRNGKFDCSGYEAIPVPDERDKKIEELTRRLAWADKSTQYWTDMYCWASLPKRKRKRGKMPKWMTIW